jgi:hypothetical protein
MESYGADTGGMESYGAEVGDRESYVSEAAEPESYGMMTCSLTSQQDVTTATASEDSPSSTPSRSLCGPMPASSTAEHASAAASSVLTTAAAKEDPTLKQEETEDAKEVKVEVEEDNKISGYSIESAAICIIEREEDDDDEQSVSYPLPDHVEDDSPIERLDTIAEAAASSDADSLPDFFHWNTQFQEVCVCVCACMHEWVCVCVCVCVCACVCVCVCVHVMHLRECMVTCMRWRTFEKCTFVWLCGHTPMSCESEYLHE